MTKKDFFDDMLGDLNKLLKDLLENRSGNNNTPIIYGFSVIKNEDGEPHIERLDINSEELFKKLGIAWMGEMFNEEEDEEDEDIPPMEPLVDVLEEDDCVYVTAEMPEFEEDNLVLNIEGDTVYIHAGNGLYRIEAHLPCEVDDNEVEV
ncbi:MAG: Hsp20/alpha crystallin family protein, partial [Methermicoccaceae archaeon]